MPESSYDSVDIQIALPLPLDVVARLTSAIGAIWPDAVIAPTPNVSLFSGRGLTFRIPDSNRYEPRPVIETAELADADDQQFESNLTEWSDEAVGVSFPEALTSYTLHLCKSLFSEYNDDIAPNYVEMIAFDRDTGDKWAVTAQRPRGLTPHQARQAAEERAATAEAALTRALADVAFLRERLAEKEASG